jgi:hypothetical protein
MDGAEADLLACMTFPEDQMPKHSQLYNKFNDFAKYRDHPVAFTR